MKYIYHAEVISVHDGDTFHARIDLNTGSRRHDCDLGFSTYVEGGRIYYHADLRLFGINAPELATTAGRNAFEYFDSMLRNDDDRYAPLIIETIKQADHEKQEKYGRWLAWVWQGGAPLPLDVDLSLNQRMVDSGHAYASWHDPHVCSLQEAPRRSRIIRMRFMRYERWLEDPPRNRLGMPRPPIMNVQPVTICDRNLKDGPKPPPRSPLGTFERCPLCDGELHPEHAHFRCAGCGWRDSCCD